MDGGKKHSRFFWRPGPALVRPYRGDDLAEEERRGEDWEIAKYCVDMVIFGQRVWPL